MNRKQVGKHLEGPDVQDHCNERGLTIAKSVWYRVQYVTPAQWTTTDCFAYKSNFIIDCDPGDPGFDTCIVNVQSTTQIRSEMLLRVRMGEICFQCIHELICTNFKL